MNYVTQEELDRLLRGYEKIGSLDAISTRLDSQFRKIIIDSIDNLKGVLKAEHESRVGHLTQKFESVVKSSIDAAKTSNFKEMSSAVRTQIDNQSKSILDDTLKVIEKKTQEIRFGLEQSITQKLIINQKEVDSTLSILKTDIYKQIVGYQSFVENLCVTSIQKAVDSHKNTLETMMNDALSNHYNKLKEDFTQMKAEIELELDKKVVDKSYIEDKLQKMERELVAKTTENINFQLDQSRNMMEQSARAEINETLKAASSNLLKSLQ